VSRKDDPTLPNAYVLDAYALLALLAGEAGADQVAAILEDPNNEVRVSAINVGEVYYILLRRRGREAAQRAEETIFQQPGVDVVAPTWERIRAAAEIKAEGGLSFADAFAAALAREASAPLVTGDPEFAALERRGMIRVIWLNRA